VRLRYLAALAAFVALAATAAVLLRTSSDDEPLTAAEVYAAAVAAGPARVTVRSTVELPGGGDALRATATGIVDVRNAGASTRVTFEPDANPFDVAFYDAVATADVTYVRGPGGSASYPNGTGGPRPLSEAPDTAVAYLRDATSWFELDDETVDGLRLRRFRGSAPSLKGGTFDVWVDADDRPVRIERVVLKPLRATDRVDIAKYGKAGAVLPPTDATAYGDREAAYDAVGLT